MMSWYSWAPYVPAAVKRQRSANKLAKLGKKGFSASPVRADGRTIARSFWGQAWCANLEAYSDFSNRLPRGRTYLRNGSVLHLGVKAGRIDAFVAGSDLYKIQISIAPVPVRQWAAIRKESAGRIGSLVELLRGRLSNEVMDTVTRKGTGLFPAPKEIQMECSCPDWATLCKHLAAVLYGVSVRLDERHELLFLLRGVDHEELIAEAAAAPIAAGAPEAGKALGLDASGLSALFGIDVEEEVVMVPPSKKARPSRTPAVHRPVTKAPAAPALRKAPLQEREATPIRFVQSLRAGTTVTAKELAALGISAATRQNWLTEEVLMRTDVRGLYRTTARTRRRVERYLEKSRLTARS
jgi:uncharacterized Zn finger protein